MQFLQLFIIHLKQTFETLFTHIFFSPLFESSNRKETRPCDHEFYHEKELLALNQLDPIFSQNVSLF